MPKSVPLRASVTTSVEPGTSRAASVASLQAGIARLRKKWSLPPTKRATSARSLLGASSDSRSGSSSRSSISVPARLRLWPSSPICSIWATIALTSTGPVPAHRLAEQRTEHRRHPLQPGHDLGPYAP
jgi:hypothetical protein